MAKVNRYTNISIPRYNPRSLQELMMVPAYKRQEHDKINESIAGLESQLAQYDGLDIHGDLLAAEQKKLYDQMLNQANTLESEGFSPSSKSNFLRFNKKYQQAVGPTGIIGKIGAAKEAMEREKASYIANATKMGYSPEAAAANWEDHVNKYGQAFANSGRVEDIEGLYAPNYKDAVTEFRSLLKEAGMSSKDIGNISSQIVFDPGKGSYVLTRKGREAIGDNKKQLQAAVDYINNQINNPNTTIGKSLLHNRQTANDVLAEVSGLEGVYQKDSLIREEGSQITGWNPADGNDLTNSGMGLTLANQQFTPAKYSDRNYGDITADINALSNKKNLTPQERTELAELTKFKEDLDVTLNAEPRYQQLKTELAKQQEILTNGTYKIPEDSAIIGAINAREDITELGKQEAIARLQDNARAEQTKKVNQIEEQMDEFAAPFVKQNTIQLSGYQLTPNTNKQNTIVKLLNNNIDRLFKANPENINNFTNIESVIVDGENETDISERDKDNIAKILYNSKPGSITLTQAIPKGFSGKPEYVLRVETDDDSDSYNMQGLDFTRDDNIGGGRPLEIRVSFDETGNGLVNNVNGLIQEYYASVGPMGQELVNSMEINRMKSLYSGRTWAELNEMANVNPVLNQMRGQELRKLGIDENSTPDEVTRAMEILNNKMLK